MGFLPHFDTPECFGSAFLHQSRIKAERKNVIKYSIIYSKNSHLLFGEIEVFEKCTLNPIIISATESKRFWLYTLLDSSNEKTLSHFLKMAKYEKATF